MVKTLLVVFLLLVIIANVSAEYVYRKSENHKLLKLLDSICTYSAGMIIVIILIMVIIN